MPTAAGNLPWKPLAEGLDLVPAPVAAAAAHVPGARVASVDPAVADTDEFCPAHDIARDKVANCVVVEGRRGDEVRMAAVLVLATDRADINRTVRKHLGVRKVSFAAQEAAEAATGMTQGSITPVGLPDGWRILVDEAVASAGPVAIGGGFRTAKLLVDGAELAQLPGAEVLSLALPHA